MNHLVTIGPITTSKRAGVHRVEAIVQDEPLWFESADAYLAPAAEAFGGALLLPTLAAGRTLHIEDPVCPDWRRQLSSIGDLLQQWWNYPQRAPRTRDKTDFGGPRNPSVGLLLTGGADSFFSLLQSPRPIDKLVYVLDFDVPPHAPQRFSRFEPHLRQIAAESGAQAIVVRSNLRRHPAFRGPSWHHTHGAALIAVGHLLRESIGTLIVSSSHPRTRPEKWGTHWDLDPLWSTRQMQVVHFGEDTRRSEKIRSLVNNPLAQRMLRPCWENEPSGLNCSVCEKCVRTQLVISRWGDLSRFSAFDHSHSLAERLWNIRRIPRADRLLSYDDCLQAPLPAETHEAVAALIRRSQRYIRRKNIERRVLQVVLPWRWRGHIRPA